MVAEARFELAASGLWARRATRLLYSAMCVPCGSVILGPSSSFDKSNFDFCVQCACGILRRSYGNSLEITRDPQLGRHRHLDDLLRLSAHHDSLLLAEGKTV